MATLEEIKTQDWQLSLDEPGGVATDVSDINQCILTILASPRGSDPMRPEFGSDIFRYLDRPVSEAIPAIYRAALESVRLWEPRIEVNSVTAELADGNLKVTLDWTDIRQGNTSQTTLIYER